MFAAADMCLHREDDANAASRPAPLPIRFEWYGVIVLALESGVRQAGSARGRGTPSAFPVLRTYQSAEAPHPLALSIGAHFSITAEGLRSRRPISAQHREEDANACPRPAPPWGWVPQQIGRAAELDG